GDDRFPVGEPQAVEDVERLGNRQVDVVRDRAPLDLDRKALGFEPLTATDRTGTQRSIRLQLALLGPAAPLETPTQVRQQPLEFAAAEEQDFARLPRQPAERHIEIDPELARQRLQLLPDQLAIAANPGGDRAVVQRLRLVRDDTRRIEVDRR